MSFGSGEARETQEMAQGTPVRWLGLDKRRDIEVVRAAIWECLLVPFSIALLKAAEA